LQIAVPLQANKSTTTSIATSQYHLVASMTTSAKANLKASATRYLYDEDAVCCAVSWKSYHGQDCIWSHAM